MALDPTDARLAPLRERLTPYARTLLERAGLHALRLHADVVSLEHLLAVLLEDPESAAHQLVLHAFADPETIAGETLAISPGVMVVAADSTLPFSVHGLEALRRARSLALESGTEEVDVATLLHAALETLGDEARAGLEQAGFRMEARQRAHASGTGASALEEPLFKRFSMNAKRSLSAANRQAAQAQQRSISPAQLVIGCLKTEEPLAERVGLTWQRARLLLASHTQDETLPEPRRLPPEEGLLAFLQSVPPGAGSLELLAAMRTAGPPELGEILARHKISSELLERAQGAFQDPNPAP